MTDAAKWTLSGADRSEEFGDFGTETAAVTGQRLGRREHLRGRRTGLGRTALHVGDAGRDLLGTLRRLLHVAGNLLRRRALLFHGGSDGRGDFGEFLDRARDF